MLLSKPMLLAMLILAGAARATVAAAVGNADPNQGGDQHASEMLQLEKTIPWGKAVDGIACRLLVQPRYVIGQAIRVVIEVKNTSDKKRYIVSIFDPQAIDYVSIRMSGPERRVLQSLSGRYHLFETNFQSIAPGEVKRFDVLDLRNYFREVHPLWLAPGRVRTGKYTLQLRFSSPEIPKRFVHSPADILETPAEMLNAQWANTAMSEPVAFELLPLTKDNLVVHEWGVFTVFNDMKYANADRKEEWGSLPSFFYRQFPNERLRWIPGKWNKPIIYFYAKQSPLQLQVKVTFSKGAPVVWWPAVETPAQRDGFPGVRRKAKKSLARSLTWETWLGDHVPYKEGRSLIKAELFPLPPDCWLQQARLPAASPITVVGNAEGRPAKLAPGVLDRPETERFLYYDGLVPAPDYLRCEKVNDASLTLRNRAKFDIARLFVVDRRVGGAVRFAVLGESHQPFKAGTALAAALDPVAATQWPATGIRRFRRALLDAGLFEPEADALLKIWVPRLFESAGVTAFHILPADEYDRMLRLEILPAPVSRPIRVGIALHPHMEIEPVLADRSAALIRQLDDNEFQKRADATKTLLELGPLAIAMLRAELDERPSLEMRQRIQGVLERVDATQWLNALETAKERTK